MFDLSVRQQDAIVQYELDCWWGQKQKRQNPAPWCTTASIVKSILDFVQHQAWWYCHHFVWVLPCFFRAPTHTSYSSLILIPFLPLLGRNTDYIVRNSTTKKGRKRYLCSISYLALGLAWTRNCGSYIILQIIFGFTHGSLSVWLRFSRELL